MIEERKIKINICWLSGEINVLIKEEKKSKRKMSVTVKFILYSKGT
jgi:hypothetical protein